MRRVFLASAAAAALSIAATAALADETAASPSTPAVTTNWSGYYLGASAGYNWANVGTHEGTPQYNGPPPINYHANGFTIGAHGGYNWLLDDQIVGGVEAEFGYLGASGSAQYGPYVGVRLPTDSRSAIHGGAFFTATARLGVLIDPDTLLFVKGGYATAGQRSSFIDNDPTGTTLVAGTKVNKWRSGATVGGGIDFANTGILPQPWTIRLEYAYYDFGHVNQVAQSFGGTLYPFRHSASEQNVRVGFTYHFN